MKPVNNSELAGRVKKFLTVNQRAKLTDLKLHLECTGTDLLLACGRLMEEGYAAVERDGADMWVSKNTPENESV